MWISILEIKTPITHTDPDKFLQELHELNVVTNMVCATHTLWNVIKSLSHTLPDPYIFVITDAVRNGYGNETTIRDILKHKNATVCNFTIFFVFIQNIFKFHNENM